VSTGKEDPPKWKNNACSPVLFFVDDLSNRWVDDNRDGIIRSEGDYGFLGNEQDGAISYLEREILSENPAVKVTFFAVVDSMSPPNETAREICHSYPMNENEEKREFFRNLQSKPEYELAYHGLNHGMPGETTDEFTHEWETFQSAEEAVDNIEKGINIFKDTVGTAPSGGKYCGYRSNDLSDESVDATGFDWWCRFYNNAAVNGFADVNYSGEDSNPTTAFDIKHFGLNGVIDIPTTVSGRLLCNVLKRQNGIRGFLKRYFKPLLLWWKLREIRYLLKHNLVISIQEHISPVRGDGKRQRMNIRDDRDSLRTILKYLKRKNVWYCTGSELAEWINKKSKL